MAAEDLCGKRRAASRKKGWNASMANGLLKKLFGNYSKRELKRIQPLVDQVLGYEEKYKKISDEELKSQTSWFKERLAQGETLDGILPEAFAACREAMARVLSIRLFPVQVQGGIILHQGRIAEMKTGEGKTFTLALPAYLNALTGKGVHIVTVNEYLAKYQGEMMARVFNFMGLTVGLHSQYSQPAKCSTNHFFHFHSRFPPFTNAVLHHNHHIWFGWCEQHNDLLKYPGSVLYSL